MAYRRLGRSGVRVAPLALGTFNFGNRTEEEVAGRMLSQAVNGGINLIDTADSYADGESERIIGRWLKQRGRREEVVLATKAHYPTGPGPNDQGNSRLHLMAACEASLRRLQVDHIDLYQIHRPDPMVPVEETLGALTDLVRQGKIRYAGCSTHPAWQVLEALLLAEAKGMVRYVSEQPPYNLLDRRIENELIPLAQKYDLAVLPWAPLAQGVLAGRYDDAEAFPEDSRAAQIGGIYAERVTPRGIEVGHAFSRLAREAGLSPAQLAVLWVKEQPGVTAPLIGPRTVAQLEELLPVLEQALDPAVAAACDELVPPGSVRVDFHNTAPWMKMEVG